MASAGPSNGPSAMLGAERVEPGGVKGGELWLMPLPHFCVKRALAEGGRQLGPHAAPPEAVTPATPGPTAGSPLAPGLEERRACCPLRGPTLLTLLVCRLRGDAGGTGVMKEGLQSDKGCRFKLL